MFVSEGLELYQKALALAERVSDLASSFAQQHRHVADQLSRASLSVCLSIAEGSGRRTDADRRSFLGIARGSVQERVPLIELCRRKRLFADIVCEEMKAGLEIIAKTVSWLVRRTRGQRSSVRCAET